MPPAFTFRIVAVYLCLLLMAAPIPLLHFYWIDEVLETTRSPSLMPATFLPLKWLSELALNLLGVIVFFAVWIFYHPKHFKLATASLAAALLLLNTLYGVYAATLLTGIISEEHHITAVPR